MPARAHAAASLRVPAMRAAAAARIGVPALRAPRACVRENLRPFSTKVGVGGMHSVFAGTGPKGFYKSGTLSTKPAERTKPAAKKKPIPTESRESQVQASSETAPESSGQEKPSAGSEEQKVDKNIRREEDGKTGRGAGQYKKRGSFVDGVKQVFERYPDNCAYVTLCWHVTHWHTAHRQFRFVVYGFKVIENSSNGFRLRTPAILDVNTRGGLRVYRICTGMVYT